MGQDSEIEANYFGLAAAWDEELYGKLKDQRKVAFIVAGVCGAIAAMSVGAVMMLTPLKTVTPYVVVVDKTTGHSEAVRELVYNEANPLTDNEAIVTSELASYIIGRETFDPYDRDERFFRMQMTTQSEEFSRYRLELEETSKGYNTDSRRKVKITSIIPNLEKKSATVRFSTELINYNNITTEYWIASVNYDFLDLEIPMKYRFINPLGFIVQNYRVDPETVN